jgi:hypothetical protein
MGMKKAKTFCPWKQEYTLLSPSPVEWLHKSHLAFSC